MVISPLALLFALVGALMYGFSVHGKIQEIGRILFFSGVFVFLMTAGAHTVHLP